MSREHIPLDKTSRAPTIDDGPLHQVLPDLAYLRLAIVNVAFFGVREGGDERTVPDHHRL